MTWPYDDPLEPLEAPSPFPRWDCPGGICECHPTDGEAKTTKVAILLRDDLGARMPGAHCRVWYGGRLIASDLVADGDGWVTPEIPERASVLYLEWAPASLPREPGYPISKSYVVNLPRRQRREAVRTRLANLGYENGPLLDDDVRAFEVDHGHAPSGDWQQIEHELESYHDQGSEPAAASKPTTQLAFFGDEDAPAPPGGGGSPIPTQSGSAQFSSDFPTPLQAKAQGKIFHEFQTATTQIKDGQGREWSVMLLVSHDALKWEVPTETVRGAGVSASEGKYWERTFRDLKTPDPLVTGLNPLRAIRLPTSARDFQAFADDFRFSVANLLKLKRLKHVESFADLGTPPSNDRALSCLLPTTMVLDLRFSMTGHGAPQTHTGGGDPRLSVLIPQVHDVNGRMNALYTAHSAMVGNPGKLWIIHNKLYADPHGARTRRHH
ncbi:MAG: hypothetical protein KC731_25260, partial [Myxococcales bacterium]|nr:hypothetical protein [Myxococcales bacterium]